MVCRTQVSVGRARGDVDVELAQDAHGLPDVGCKSPAIAVERFHEMYSLICGPLLCCCGG